MYGINSLISSFRSAGTVALDPRGSYFLAEGLGGLSRSIATWMVEHGARSSIFLSRSAGLNESDQTLFSQSYRVWVASFLLLLV